MPNMTAVLGTQWGDEGKGKVVDFLARGYSVAARINGGANAGHSVEYDDGTRRAYHLLPPCSTRPNIRTVVLGRGVLIDPVRLEAEAAWVKQENPDVQIWVDSQAHVVLPEHLEADAEREELLGENAIGTTRRGIGPAQAARALRQGVQISQLHNPIPGVQLVPGNRIRGLIHKEPTLLAGAHGFLLDLYGDDYPFVTSTGCNLDTVGPGLGISPRDVGCAVGVVKAYMTRIGHGPMATEFEGDLAERIRKVGNEYGTTTGRPRRIGWLDMVALREACLANRYDYLALTHMDVLDGIDAYAYSAGHRPLPFRWEGVRSATSWESLDADARAFIRYIEKLTDTPVLLIGTGPARGEMIDRR